MNDLFRFGCLHLSQFLCNRDRLITADNAFILRTHKVTSACKRVCRLPYVCFSVLSISI